MSENYSTWSSHKRHGMTEEWKVRSIVMLSGFMIIIIALNWLLFVLFVTKKSSCSKFVDTLLCNQACVDLTNGFILIPVKILAVQQNPFCLKFLDTFICFSNSLTLLTHLSVAADRCFSTTKPLLHRKVMSTRLVRYLLSASWILALLLTLTPFSWWGKEPFTRPGKYMRYYTLFLALFKITLILIVLVLSFMTFQNAFHRPVRAKGVKSEIHRSLRRRNSRRNEVRAATLFVWMVLVFCVSYIPSVVRSLFDIFNVDYNQLVLTDTSMYLYLSSSIFNALATLKFKFARTILKSFSSCRRQPARKRADTELISV